MMKTLEEIKSILQANSPDICQRFRVTEMWVFGSYARQQQTALSDVDLLIDYEQAPTLWMLVELRDYLENLLKVKVDVVTEKGLKPRLRDRVLAEAIKV